jgi:hypothetical protein
MPIIATAAFPAEFLYEDIAIRVGADRFFRMPFEMKTFTKAVRTLFPGRARLETGLSSAPLSTFRAGRPGFNA